MFSSHSKVNGLRQEVKSLGCLVLSQTVLTIIQTFKGKGSTSLILYKSKSFPLTINQFFQRKFRTGQSICAIGLLHFNFISKNNDFIFGSFAGGRIFFIFIGSRLPVGIVGILQIDHVGVAGRAQNSILIQVSGVFDGDYRAIGGTKRFDIVAGDGQLTVFFGDGEMLSNIVLSEGNLGILVVG